MKLPFLALLGTLGLAGAYVAYRSARPSIPSAVDPASLHAGHLSTALPPEEVFKRALWRRPTAEDKILHAERREWTVDPFQGVSEWQWFLAIEPSPALLKWLRETNPFSLRPARDAVLTDIKGPPVWFPRDAYECEIQAGGNQGRLVFLYSRESKMLYATGSGQGMTPGAPEAVKPPLPPLANGRLPQTPPPNPSER